MDCKTVFRYPGGKTKLAKSIVAEVVSQSPHTFVDVFAGGGSVFVEVMNQFPQAKIIINDLDEYIYAFWEALIEKRGQDIICMLYEKGKPNVAMFIELREILQRPMDIVTKAFVALFFNRTTFSGIFRSGPIGGYEQKGNYKIDVRYNIQTLERRITELEESLLACRATCKNEDFRRIIREYGDDKHAMLYLDPPYMRQGKQLYAHMMFPEDYQEMADLLQQCCCKWIISHDNYMPFVEMFSEWAHITDTEKIPYTINSYRDNRKKEILVANFPFEVNKRRPGRPKFTDNIYSLVCCLCGCEIKTNPAYFRKYCNKNQINVNDARNTYKCRKCKKIILSP